MAFVELFSACALGLLLLLTLWIKWKRSRLEHLVENIPSPPAWPIIGHTYLALRIKSTSDVLKISSGILKYGNLVKLWNVHELLFLVNDHKIVEALMSSPDAVEKGKLYTFFSGNLGGVFIAEKKNWQGMRKALNLTFNPKLMEGYLSVFNNKSIQLLSILEKRENENFDPEPYLARCMIDTIIETHFGVESNEQIYNKGNIFECMTKVYENTVMRFSKIWLHPDFIYKRTSHYQENRKVKTQPSRYFLEVMKNCLKRVESAHNTENFGDRPTYYIDSLVESLQQKGLHPDPHLMKFMTSDIIIAGYETSSSTLSHLLYNLAVHPCAQAKVHAELDEVFEGRESGAVVKQDFNKLKYLDMVINEITRLFGPPFILRQLQSDLETEQGILPGGSVVYVSIYTIHRDQKFWEYPDQFYPEHFLPEKVDARPRYAYLPFSAGPRNCPGKLYAKWVIKVVAAHILRKYRVMSVKQPENVEYKVALMLEPINGHSICLIPRG